MCPTTPNAGGKFGPGAHAFVGSGHRWDKLARTVARADIGAVLGLAAAPGEAGQDSQAQCSRRDPAGGADAPHRPWMGSSKCSPSRWTRRAVVRLCRCCKFYINLFSSSKPTCGEAPACSLLHTYVCMCVCVCVCVCVWCVCVCVCVWYIL